MSTTIRRRILNYISHTQNISFQQAIQIYDRMTKGQKSDVLTQLLCKDLNDRLKHKQSVIESLQEQVKIWRKGFDKYAGHSHNCPVDDCLCGFDDFVREINK